MNTHIHSEISISTFVAAVAIAIVFILIMSLLKEPIRQKYNAIILAGAGAAYLSGGLGPWEFVFCTGMTFIAYKGLSNYYFIAAGWLLHTCWDVLHHLHSNPIVPFDATSSAGCAVCDAVLAIWFFFKAPSVTDWIFKPKTLHLNLR